MHTRSTTGVLRVACIHDPFSPRFSWRRPMREQIAIAFYYYWKLKVRNRVKTWSKQLLSREVFFFLFVSRGDLIHVKILTFLWIVLMTFPSPTPSSTNELTGMIGVTTSRSWHGVSYVLDMPTPSWRNSQWDAIFGDWVEQGNEWYLDCAKIQYSP